MTDLITKLREARKTVVAAGGYSFIVRRPTDIELGYMMQEQMRQGDVLERFVMGWAGVRELDIIDGGSDAAVDFSTELFMEWVADRPDLWGPLCDAVWNAYSDHFRGLNEKLGKLSVG